jgi:hypothetical protein
MQVQLPQVAELRNNDLRPNELRYSLFAVRIAICDARNEPRLKLRELKTTTMPVTYLMQ